MDNENTAAEGHVNPCGSQYLCHPILSHHLPEHKHLIILAPAANFFFRDSGTVVVLVPELHDVEASFCNYA